MKINDASTTSAISHVPAFRMNLTEFQGIFGVIRRMRNISLLCCPNQIKVTDPFLERVTDDIFRKTRDDNDPGVSCEDRTFLEILDRGIHKNARGNWEMPLPFRNDRQTMPNNRD